MENIPDTVKDVDQDEEEGDEQGHASGHHLGLDEEGHPGDDDEHAARQIDLDQILHRFPDQSDLEATGGVSTRRQDNRLVSLR